MFFHIVKEHRKSISYYPTTGTIDAGESTKEIQKRQTQPTLEDIMTTNTNTTSKNHVDAGYETSKFALGVGISMAALVGLWGAVSLISALASNGPAGLVKSYLTAVIGM